MRFCRGRAFSGVENTRSSCKLFAKPHFRAVPVRCSLLFSAGLEHFKFQRHFASKSCSGHSSGVSYTVQRGLLARDSFGLEAFRKVTR